MPNQNIVEQLKEKILAFEPGAKVEKSGRFWKWRMGWQKLA